MKTISCCRDYSNIILYFEQRRLARCNGKRELSGAPAGLYWPGPGRRRRVSVGPRRERVAPSWWGGRSAAGRGAGRAGARGRARPGPANRGAAPPRRPSRPSRPLLRRRRRSRAVGPVHTCRRRRRRRRSFHEVFFHFLSFSLAVVSLPFSFIHTIIYLLRFLFFFYRYVLRTIILRLVSKRDYFLTF